MCWTDTSFIIPMAVEGSAIAVSSGERLKHKDSSAQRGSADDSVRGPESPLVGDLDQALHSSYLGHHAVRGDDDDNSFSHISALSSCRMRHRISREWRTEFETSVSVSGRATWFLLLVES